MCLACYVHTQNLELCRATGDKEGEIVSLLNLGTTCELMDELDKAIEWHTLVSYKGKRFIAELQVCALYSDSI